jgi:hypothetical protein
VTPHQSIVARKFLGWGVQVMEAKTGIPAATVSGGVVAGTPAGLLDT